MREILTWEYRFWGICLLAALAASTILANKNLFLWQFLKGGIYNQVIFSVLFANQYIAPMLYLLLSGANFKEQSYGAELFIMVAGVFATLGFLLSQSFAQNKVAK